MKTYLGANCHILHWFDLCAPQFRGSLLTIKSIKRKSESSQRQKYQTVLVLINKNSLTDTTTLKLELAKLGNTFYFQIMIF